MKRKKFFWWWICCFLFLPLLANAKNNFQEIDVQQLLQLQKKYPHLLLIDVREPEELSGPLGHIKGVINIPLTLLVKNPQLIPKTDQPIVFICRSGRRSAEAAKIALKQGYKNIYSLKGGMKAWNKFHQNKQKKSLPQDSPTDILEEDMGC